MCSTTVLGPMWAEALASPGSKKTSSFPGREASLVSMVMAGHSSPLKVQLPSSSPVESFNKGSKYLGSKWFLKEPPSPSFQNLVKATPAHCL